MHVQKIPTFRSVAILASDFSALTRLQAIATQLVPLGDRNELLSEILSAAVDLTGTDKGNIQYWDPDSSQLRIAVHQGLGQRFVEHFAEKGWAATCEMAAARRERVIVEDIGSLGIVSGGEEIKVVLDEGIRAIQSTPLLSRDGLRLLGMLNTHYATPHGPGERELHYLDLLARLAADFIERCEAESALTTTRRELEAALRASQRSQEIVRESDRRKDTFLATLSHELRGPLTPISNALQVLNQNPDDPAVSSWARNVMQRQLSQLSQLVDDLLDLNRIAQDKIKLHMQPLVLQEVIDPAIEACRPFLFAKNHKLLLAIPPEHIYVQADEVRLTQVLVNLIHNACKYTAHHGEVRVTVEHAGAEAVIRVRDSGAGIHADAVDTIFELFKQEKSSAGQSDGGLGIGLYLVKRLVEMHGGTVTASSDGVGRGSEFVVRLAAV